MAYALILSAATANAEVSTVVTNGDDSGAGSLRAALESGADVITIAASVNHINIHDTLTYNGTLELQIQGSGQTIFADDDYTILAITQGADLTISNLDFQGIGRFSAKNQGSGKGIFIDVPTDRTGVVTLELDEVSVSDVAYHGVHISDCSFNDDCGAGGGGGGDGSPASIRAVFDEVEINGVGNGRFDADGLRIDDRGDGDIIFEAEDSLFVGVGADGVELDEGDDGDVFVEISDTHFYVNGGYCRMVEADPTLDERCFDEGELDLDDGFDIDEAADGSIFVSIQDVDVNGNYDEGLDFDEEGVGNIVVELDDVSASLNTDEGVKCSEADDGDIEVEISSSMAISNGDDGMQFESEDDGRVDVEIEDTVIMGSSKEGLNVSQDDETDPGTLELRDVRNVDGYELLNVILI